MVISPFKNDSSEETYDRDMKILRTSSRGKNNVQRELFYKWI